jgi:16S rRNA (uracil1498-N3)-methyltransferase
MRDHHHFLFYCRHAETNHVLLDSEEAHHAATVLRLAKDDPFLATDGKGTIYTCSLESFDKKGLTGIITSRATEPRHPCDLHLLVGLPERAAFESLLVDLAALGVRRISPIVCKHCQKPWWVRDWKKFEERFSSKMASGMKQSLYPYLPDLDPPMNFDEAIGTVAEPAIVADAKGVSITQAFKAVRGVNDRVSAIIGPPGGLSFEEQSRLKGRGAVAVKIAPTRLTTELAAVVVSGLIIGTNDC